MIEVALSLELTDTFKCRFFLNRFPECLNLFALVFLVTPCPQCDLCNKWNHIECVGISSAYYEKLQNDIKPWYCPHCSKDLQFSEVGDKDLCNTMHVPQTHFTDVQNKESKELMREFQ